MPRAGQSVCRLGFSGEQGTPAEDAALGALPVPGFSEPVPVGSGQSSARPPGASRGSAASLGKAESLSLQHLHICFSSFCFRPVCLIINEIPFMATWFLLVSTFR